MVLQHTNPKDNPMPDMNTIEYGAHVINVDALPHTSILALVRRGLSHYLGNEQASKLTAWKQRDENKSATDEQVAGHKASLVQAAIEALTAGTVGIRAPRQPSIDPVEREMERIALREVSAVLKANGLKMPKGEATVTFGTGEGQTMLTQDDLVERRLTKHGDRIRKEAEAEIKRKAREAKKVADTVAGADAASELL